MYKSNLMDEWEKTHNPGYSSGHDHGSDPQSAYASGFGGDTGNPQDVYAHQEEESHTHTPEHSDSLLDNLDTVEGPHEDYQSGAVENEAAGTDTLSSLSTPLAARDHETEAELTKKSKRSLDDAISRAIKEETDTQG